MSAISDRPVLLLGAGGMLGSHLGPILGERFATVAPFGRRKSAVESVSNTVSWLPVPADATKPEEVTALVREVRPRAIVNCIAITSRSPLSHDPIACIEVNGLFPHRLARVAGEVGAYLIHISTDGVFSGNVGNYSEQDHPDPVDLYGRSKLVGEVTEGICLTIRTTFVCSCTEHPGLISFLMANRGGSVVGYANYVFSALGVNRVCRAIVALLERDPPFTGLYHVGGEAISKFELLTAVTRELRLGVDVVAAAEPVVNRSLNSTRFWTAVGVAAPDIESLVREIADGLASDRRAAKRR